MKFFGDRRAVSPIFATVLLILIVVLIMSSLFAFSTGYVADFQLRQGAAVMELITIEDVWFGYPDSDNIRLTLYNYGKLDVKVTFLYLNDSKVDFLNPLDGENFIEIPIYGHGEIIVGPVTIIEDTSYLFRVASEKGSTFDFEYVSPKEPN